MIVGRDFAWAHLGKTGGETTHALFHLFPGVVEFADPVHTPEQHTAFQDRPALVAGKKRVLGIRRLPAWMLSHHIWQAYRGLEPDFTSAPMRSPYEIASSDIADRFLARYLPAAVAEVRIDVWLRTERLIEDFLAFIGRHTSVSDAQRQAVRLLPCVNASFYDRAFGHWFTPADVAQMYARNPAWAAVEAEVYGDSQQKLEAA